MDLIAQAAIKLERAGYAIALTGAGISTDSNIPDYRGPHGVWTLDPKAEERAYEAYRVFVQDPKRYWSQGYGKHILLEQFMQARPNRGHEALARLEGEGHVKATITQNIDGLHRKAGTRNLIEYHGNAQRLRCLGCGSRYDLFDEELPTCKKCGSIMKSDIVNFGEPIPPDVLRESVEEVMSCDLMIICGTSAVVYPFASLPSLLKERKGSNSFIIEINLSPTQLTKDGITDLFIQGATSEVLTDICRSLSIIF